MHQSLRPGPIDGCFETRKLVLMMEVKDDRRIQSSQPVPEAWLLSTGACPARPSLWDASLHNPGGAKYGGGPLDAHALNRLSARASLDLDKIPFGCSERMSTARLGSRRKGDVARRRTSSRGPCGGRSIRACRGAV